MNTPIGDRVAAFMQAKGWTADDMAKEVRRWQRKLKQPESCSRQNIQGLTKGSITNPRYVAALAYAMGMNADSLLAPDPVGQTPATVEKVTASAGNGVQGQDTVGSQLDQLPTIPTTMPYTHTNLSSTILLLGSLLGCLDKRSRRVIGSLLGDLAETPDDAQDIADKSAALATVQRPIAKDKRLNKMLTHPNATETAPGGLPTK